MGNYMCVGVNDGHQVIQDVEWELPPIKVVKPDGEIQVFKRSVSVSELIKLHGPDHFVCHSKALITSLTPKAVLPKDQQLEAGRLYYILPNSKLLQDYELEQNSNNLDRKPAVRAGSASGAPAVKESTSLPFEIKLHSKKQQVPGFAQVTVRGQDVARLVSTDRISGHHVEDRESQTISYSTPDLRSMYLMNGPSSRKTLTRSNSWKPRLETISEVSAYSRRRIQELVRGRSQKSSSQVHSSS